MHGPSVTIGSSRPQPGPAMPDDRANLGAAQGALLFRAFERRQQAGVHRHRQGER
jgi:hypothetical protein